MKDLKRPLARTTSRRSPAAPAETHQRRGTAKNGVILGSNVYSGKKVGRTVKALLDKLDSFSIELVVGGTAYKTTAIARLLNLQGIELLSTYRRPQTKDGFFPKYESVYDAQYDCCLCPGNEVLHYHTTNRDGNRAHCSDPKVCVQFLLRI